ncbi:hypothetical protein GCM10025860_20140 [Methanobacterium ferruginis]|nr:hypothetical protein GCM10025860_20140 [Methanobacterium ferruginis]
MHLGEICMMGLFSSVTFDLWSGSCSVNVLQYDVYTLDFANRSGSLGVNVLLYYVYTLDLPIHS